MLMFRLHQPLEDMRIEEKVSVTVNRKIEPNLPQIILLWDPPIPLGQELFLDIIGDLRLGRSHPHALRCGTIFNFRNQGESNDNMACIWRIKLFLHPHRSPSIQFGITHHHYRLYQVYPAYRDYEQSLKRKERR